MNRKQIFSFLLSLAVAFQTPASIIYAEENETDELTICAEVPEEGDMHDEISSEEETAGEQNQEETDPENVQDPCDAEETAQENHSAEETAQEENSGQEQTSDAGSEENREETQTVTEGETAPADETVSSTENISDNSSSETVTKDIPEGSSDGKTENVSTERTPENDQAAAEQSPEETIPGEEKAAGPEKEEKDALTKSGKSAELSEEEPEFDSDEDFLKIRQMKAVDRGDHAEILLVSGMEQYDTITFDPYEEDNAELIKGEKEESTYYYRFNISLEELGKTVKYYARSTEGIWFTEHDLYLKLPSETEEDEDKEEESGCLASANGNETTTETDVLFLSDSAGQEKTGLQEDETEDTASLSQPGETVVSEEEAVLFLSAEAAFDNSTDLAENTYSISPEDFVWEGGTGKAHLTCESVTIKDGKATAVFSASSDNMTHAYCGYAPSNDETPSLYDPDTGRAGTNVYEIVSRSVTLPVRLNEETDLACRTVAMTEPHWVRYTYKITLNAPKAQTDTETEAETETQTKAEPEAGSEVQTESEPETEANKQTETGTEKKKTSETDAETGNKKANTKQTEKTAEKKAAGTGKLKDGVYTVGNVELAEGYRMFNVIACELTVKSGKMTAVITLHGTGLDYMYAGKAKKAVKADKSEWIPHKVDADGHFTFEVPVKVLDKVIVYSARSKRYAEMAEAGEEVSAPIWYDKGLIFHSDSVKRVKGNGEEADTEEKDKKSSAGEETEKGGSSADPGNGKTSGGSGGNTAENGSGYAANTDGSTGSVNSSTTLADGTYSPDSFNWSGGTGRLSISCSKITISGGKAYAAIVFSSGNIVYVKADGSQFSPVEQTDSASVYEVPVELNANNTILACTTAMSKPHEIEYQIFVGLEAAKKTSSAAGAGKGSSSAAVKASAASADSSEKKGAETEKKTVTTDEGLTLRVEDDFPSVPGADYIGSFIPEAAENYRMEFYSNGISLIEISLSDESGKDWDPGSESDLPADPDKEQEERSALSGDDESGLAQEKSLYESKVLRYLLVPEEAELPAGIDREMIVVRTPVEKAYLDSDSVLKFADKLGVSDRIGMVGQNAESVSGGDISKALAEGGILSIGHIGSQVYRELLQGGTDVAIVSRKQLMESMIAEEDDEINEDGDRSDVQQAVQHFGDMLALLEVPMIVDRTDDETEELGRYEWLLLYGTLMDRPEEAMEVYESVRKVLKPDTGQETGKDYGAEDKEPESGKGQTEE